MSVASLSDDHSQLRQDRCKSEMYASPLALPPKQANAHKQYETIPRHKWCPGVQKDMRMLPQRHDTNVQKQSQNTYVALPGRPQSNISSVQAPSLDRKDVNTNNIFQTSQGAECTLTCKHMRQHAYGCNLTHNMQCNAHQSSRRTVCCQ